MPYTHWTRLIRDVPDFPKPGIVFKDIMPVLADAAQAGDAWAQRQLQRCPELGGRVSDGEYEELLDYADSLGIEDYFWQQGGAAKDSFIPAFDLTGVPR